MAALGLAKPTTLCVCVGALCRRLSSTGQDGSVSSSKVNSASLFL